MYDPAIGPPRLHSSRSEIPMIKPLLGLAIGAAIGGAVGYSKILCGNGT